MDENLQFSLQSLNSLKINSKNYVDALWLRECAIGEFVLLLRRIILTCPKKQTFLKCSIFFFFKYIVKKKPNRLNSVDPFACLKRINYTLT